MDLDIESKISYELKKLKKLNPNIAGRRDSDYQSEHEKRPHRLQKVIIANRGEIAKRFFLALHEEGIPSVAVVTDVDKGQSWYEFADEVVFIGEPENYAHIFSILAAIYLVKANAVYTGYGFLSENAEFVEILSYVSEHFGYEIIFMGPDHESMRLVGDKDMARTLAKDNDIPLFEGSGLLTKNDLEKAKEEAKKIGYPVIIKLSAGGGGKGMYPVYSESELETALKASIRIGEDLYKNSNFFLEKFIEEPVHIEVQIFNGWSIGIRKCAVQRRNQKIIEENGYAFLDDYLSLSLLATAEKIAHVSGYKNGCGAGTVEFLIDVKTNKIGFMEVNTRLQVEYAVTDQSLGIDLAKWQILNFDGRGKEITAKVLLQNRLAEKDHSIECRIYAEDPDNDYLPSPGVIIEMDLPTFNGIRCDFGFCEGDNILPMYDPLIGKLITNGSNRQEALIRMERALQELYIQGIKTNITQLLKIIRHPQFAKGDYTNNFLRDTNNLQNNAEKFIISDRRNQKPVIFGGLAEFIKMLQHSINELMIIANLEGIINTPNVTSIPYRFNIKFEDNAYSLEFVQISLDTFLAYINGYYNGKIIIVSVNDRSDDFIIIFGNSSYRIRVNRFSDYISLRMRDEHYKINYYKMTVVPEGINYQKDAGLIKSPLQGSFVAFCRNLKIGDSVKKGEPLIILSSMKMETTISAHIDGKIISIIENGNIEKLQIDKTTDGRIIGRSIQEGEQLFKIDSEQQENPENNKQTETRDSIMLHHSSTLLDYLFSDRFEEIFLQNPEKNLEVFIQLLNSTILGFIQQHYIIEKLKNIIIRLPGLINKITDTTSLAKIHKLIRHFTHIKKIFSPVLSDSGVSYLEELDLTISRKDDYSDNVSKSFNDLHQKLSKNYGILKWKGKSEITTLLRQYIFILYKISHQFCIENNDIYVDLVHLVSQLSLLPEDTYATLKLAQEHEQSELDDSLLKFINNNLTEKYPQDEIKFRHSMGLEFNLINNIHILWDEDSNLVINQCRHFLENPSDTLTISFPQWAMDAFNNSITILKERYTLKSLFSPQKQIFIIITQNKETLESSYAAFSFIEISNKDDLSLLENCIFNTVTILHSYQLSNKQPNSWIEIFINSIPVKWDSTREDEINYHQLRTACDSSISFIFNNTINFGILSIPVKNNDNSIVPRQVTFRLNNEKLSLDYLYPANINYPYFLEEEKNESNQKLFNYDKWPIEIWINECFDQDSIKEILIPSIDGLPGSPIPVGSKIYQGTIKQKQVCFYMKDSRINGGSTGDKEGLKYTAAQYLSYLKDWPLLVWNDGAGANILEGVVSLNRGAEGFMLNTLLANNNDPIKFANYTTNIEDPILKNLFTELDKEFNLDMTNLTQKHRSFQLIAIGIGPSAGLDVYGSSQASIQILLDSEQSYRVLTGSNVIRTAIGEDITNYNIGGATILGKWTGIVDIIAKDKIHLVSCVNKLVSLFCINEEHAGILRPDLKDEDNSPENQMTVIHEKMLIANVDHGAFWPLKDEYYASEALVGGFAKIGGRKVLIMGARTHSGLRSHASFIKAKELLRIAHRTRSHQVIIFGKKWQQNVNFRDDISVRPRIDFSKRLHQKQGIRFHIITDMEGLKCIDINSSADIIIFINNKKYDDYINFYRKNTTLVVESLEKAFDLCHTLITYIDPIKENSLVHATDAIPYIPSDPSIPYDILESIIIPTFDKESFIEFYKEMNNPRTGPHLVTGLARLNGETVGIIADQPKQTGGGADTFGTEKFRIFTEFLNANNIPLIMLSNSSGFVPGSMQERYRIQAVGAESLDANILGEIPVVSVILKQNYGGRLIHAFNKFLRPGIVYLALSDALMAVIGVNAAFDLLKRKKYEQIIKDEGQQDADRFKDAFFNEYLDKSRASNDAFNTGVLDWLIPNVEELRENLVKGLKLAKEKCALFFNQH